VWDFSTDPEFQEKLDWADEFMRTKVEPLQYVINHPLDLRDPVRQALVPPLQEEVRRHGLWACHLGPELGGPGFGQVKLALLNEILGRSGPGPTIGPVVFGCAAPDTGNAEIIAHYGTDEQKERYLKPLLEGTMFSAFSMTEPQGGSDPNLFKTHAVQDGDVWVINGEKWFTSAGRIADLLFVMCTNGMFVVPRATPGVEIMPEPRNHNHIIYRDVRVPLDHLLGPENGARVLAQRRLGGGRPGIGHLAPPDPELIPDRLDPEDHGEDREQRPLERVRPAQPVAGQRTVELPVTQPEHAPEGDHHEQVPAQPAGLQEEVPHGTRKLGRRLGGGGIRRARVFHATRVALTVDNSCMGLRTGFAAHAKRLPDRLDDLHGPWQGTVVLPVHLTWHQLREFDVAKQRPRLLLYSIVISQGRRNDVARFLNAQRLREDWPQLSPLVSNRMRRACERKLGLGRPSAP